MSRFNDFIQFHSGQFDDVNNILETGGVTCDVYRPQYTGTPGFGKEVGTEKLIKRMLVHLARQSGVFKENVDGGVKANRISFVGLCADDDVRIGDIWEIESARYRVGEVDKGSKGKTEVRLEMLL